jgi:hypothetical protein
MKSALDETHHRDACRRQTTRALTLSVDRSGRLQADAPMLSHQACRARFEKPDLFTKCKMKSEATSQLSLRRSESIEVSFHPAGLPAPGWTANL